MFRCLPLFLYLNPALSAVVPQYSGNPRIMTIMSRQFLYVYVMSQLLAGLGGGERMAREGGEPSRLGTRNHRGLSNRT